MTSSSESAKCSLYFCRHAESRHNAFDDNTPDVDLTERGEAQARALTGPEFDLVLCSPLRRARRTLELSDIRYKQIEILPELREFVNDDSDLLPDEPLGMRETPDDVLNRCWAVRARLEMLVREDATRSILIMSHSVFGARLFSVCCGAFPRSFMEHAVLYPLKFKAL